MHCPAEAAEARLRWKGLLASCTSVSVSVPRMASPQTPKPCPVPDSPHNTESLHALRQYEAFQGNHAICVAYRKAAWSLGCSSLANQQKSVKPVVFLVSCGLAQVFAGSRCSLASKMISSCREDVQRLTGTSWNQGSRCGSRHADSRSFACPEARASRTQQFVQGFHFASQQPAHCATEEYYGTRGTQWIRLEHKARARGEQGNCMLTAAPTPPFPPIDKTVARNHTLPTLACACFAGARVNSTPVYEPLR